MEGFESEDDEKKKKTKGEMLMSMLPVKNAMEFAAINGCSFRFYDPDTDSENVRDGDHIVYMGNRSKQIADYLSHGYEVNVYKAKDIKRILNGLHDY